ncbi:hypothetical protein NKI77_33300 [Mesorhizobium opportunistum]|uniref:Uncharacterized protein n=1 Tax=Mesorhizobium opportunistum TaxID=593909 RepID=A0ABV1YRG7_9HYPH
MIAVLVAPVDGGRKTGAAASDGGWLRAAASRAMASSLGMAPSIWRRFLGSMSEIGVSAARHLALLVARALLSAENVKGVRAMNSSLVSVKTCDCPAKPKGMRQPHFASMTFGRVMVCEGFHYWIC